jgi:hypothetical protein
LSAAPTGTTAGIRLKTFLREIITQFFIPIPILKELVSLRIGELESADGARCRRFFRENGIDYGDFFCFVVRNKKESSGLDYEVF